MNNGAASIVTSRSTRRARPSIRQARMCGSPHIAGSGRCLRRAGTHRRSARSAAPRQPVHAHHRVTTVVVAVLRVAVILLAALGGFLGRSMLGRPGEPGRPGLAFVHTDYGNDITPDAYQDRPGALWTGWTCCAAAPPVWPSRPKVSCPHTARRANDFSYADRVTTESTGCRRSPPTTWRASGSPMAVICWRRPTATPCVSENPVPECWYVTSPAARPV